MAKKRALVLSTSPALGLSRIRYPPVNSTFPGAEATLLNSTFKIKFFFSFLFENQKFILDY